VAEQNRRGLGLSVPTGHSLGEFGNYQDATALVEKLVAGDFAANKISIIGHDPVLVERVRSRLGYGRIALSGAITGLWLGVLVALVIGAGLQTDTEGQINYVPQEFGAVVVVAAGIGMLFNILRFSFSKQKRSFISSQLPVASRYQVIVPEEDAVAAHKIMSAGTAK
jgi:hypothetical protein